MAATAPDLQTDADADEPVDGGARTGPPSPSVAEARFRAMGSDAHVVVVGSPGETTTALGVLVEAARRRIEQLEARWSRFVDTSEVNELNRRAGTPVRVSPDTALLVELAIEAFGLSGASFDPTVLGDVLRAGYDRSFEQLDDADPDDGEPGTRISHLLRGCDDIVVEGTTVTLPAGTGFDPGGIGKGLAADLVSEEVLAAGAAGVCVNLGGDVRLRGTGPVDGTWTVALEHPDCAEPIALVGLHDGAVATSTTLRRVWSVGGEARHHLIDPGTGLPSESDLTSVSVIAGNAWVAEILAKAVLLRGSAHPFDLIGGSGAEALAVDRDGRIQASAGLAAFLGPTPLPERLPDPRGPIPGGPVAPGLDALIDRRSETTARTSS